MLKKKDYMRKIVPTYGGQLVITEAGNGEFLYFIPFTLLEFLPCAYVILIVKISIKCNDFIYFQI